MEDYFVPYEQLATRKGMVFGSSACTDLLFLTYGNDPMLNRKFCYLLKDDILFWASDSYAAKFGMNQTFSGLYRWVELQRADFRCRIAPRFWLDFLVGGKRDKLGRRW